MINKIVCNAEDLIAIADAVRASNGSTNTYNVPELSAAAVNAIGTGGAGVSIDDTLTVSGAAADAKVVGDRVAALAEEMAKSVNGFSPDKNGAVTIKYDTISERAYRHNTLSKYPKEIKVYDNDTYANAPYVFLGRNYWPAVEYVNGAYDRHGMSFKTDKHNITVSGTATSGSSYRLQSDDGDYWDISDIFNVGEKYDLYVFAAASEYASPFCKVEIYDANKTRLVFKQTNIAAGSIFGKAGTLTIPEGAKYAMFHVAYTNGQTYDNMLFPVLVKADVTVINDQAFTGGVVDVATEDETPELCTAPYESTVQYQLALKEYIDAKSSTVDFDMAEIEKTMSFVSPEMFGAYADGLHDDTAAVQACIDYAIEHGKKVIGGGSYITSEPIRFTANYFSVDLNEILYSGTDAAFIINGSYNTIRISRIRANSGTGFRLNSDIASSYSNMYIGWIASAKNCIEYIGTSKSIVGNSLTFGYIVAGSNYYCVYHTPETSLPDGNFHNNNNFIGGRLLGGKWGVYGAKGTDSYITCQFEDVANALLMDGVGTCRVISPRYAEVAFSAIDKTQTGYPARDGYGVVFSLKSPYEKYPYEMSKTTAVELLATGGQLMPVNVDVSAAPIEFYHDDGTSEPVGKEYPGLSIVRAKLYSRNTNLLANEFMTFGRHILIREPAFKYTKHVAVSDNGYAGDYRETDKDDEFYIYDRFIIDESGCDYKLPPSYDLIAFDKFIVEQKEGTSCIFRDWRGTVIFDGANYGAGTYEVQAGFKDVDYDYYDNRNQVWTIRRIANDVVATMPQAT